MTEEHREKVAEAQRELFEAYMTELKTIFHNYILRLENYFERRRSAERLVILESLEDIVQQKSPLYMSMYLFKSRRPYDPNIAKSIRRRAGLLPEELAIKLRISRGVVKQFESGEAFSKSKTRLWMSASNYFTWLAEQGYTTEHGAYK